jgi:hypothetical protein
VSVPAVSLAAQREKKNQSRDTATASASASASGSAHVYSATWDSFSASMSASAAAAAASEAAPHLKKRYSSPRLRTRSSSLGFDKHRSRRGGGAKKRGDGGDGSSRDRGRGRVRPATLEDSVGVDYTLHGHLKANAMTPDLSVLVKMAYATNTRALLLASNVMALDLAKLFRRSAGLQERRMVSARKRVEERARYVKAATEELGKALGDTHTMAQEVKKLLAERIATTGRGDVAKTDVQKRVDEVEAVAETALQRLRSLESAVGDVSEIYFVRNGASHREHRRGARSASRSRGRDKKAAEGRPSKSAAPADVASGATESAAEDRGGHLDEDDAAAAVPGAEASSSSAAAHQHSHNHNHNHEDNKPGVAAVVVVGGGDNSKGSRTGICGPCCANALAHALKLLPVKAERVVEGVSLVQASLDRLKEQLTVRSLAFSLLRPAGSGCGHSALEGLNVKRQLEASLGAEWSHGSVLHDLREALTAPVPAALEHQPPATVMLVNAVAAAASSASAFKAWQVDRVVRPGSARKTVKAEEAEAKAKKAEERKEDKERAVKEFERWRKAKEERAREKAEAARKEKAEAEAKEKADEEERVANARSTFKTWLSTKAERSKEQLRAERKKAKMKEEAEMARAAGGRSTQAFKDWAAKKKEQEAAEKAKREALIKAERKAREEAESGPSKKPVIPFETWAEHKTHQQELERERREAELASQRQAVIDAARSKRAKAAALAMRGRLPGWMLRELELDQEDIENALQGLGIEVNFLEQRY